MNTLNIKRQITYTVSSLIPKKKNRWSFGAWMGGRFSDNPRAFLDYMKDYHPENEYFWITDHPEKIDKKDYPEVTFLKRGSKAAWKAIVTSEYLVMSHGSRDFGKYNWIGGGNRIFFDHGQIWKYSGIDAFKKKGIPFIDKLRRLNFIWNIKLEHGADFYIAPSEDLAKVLKQSYMTGDADIIRVGQPRNEIFFNEEKRKKSRANVLNILGIQNSETKLILYLPTFRDSGMKVFSFFNHIDEMKNILNDSVIIEKGHFADKSHNCLEEKNDVIFDGKDIDTQELIAAADLFVTDYSSCLFDFLVADKPIIEFEYDYDYYVNKDRGLYFSVQELDCGHIVYEEDDFFNMLKDFDEHTWTITEKQKEIKDKYVIFESINNSKIIYEFLMRRKSRKK